MTVIDKNIALGVCSPILPEQSHHFKESFFSYTHRRLNGVLKNSSHVPFDDSSRYIFFSDLHRGDGSRADAFAPNRDLFLQVLTGYYNQGYSYIEIGDGDELWKTWRFDEIYRAHEQVFDLLHQFDCKDRLHVIAGNHDLVDGRRGPVDKGGIVAHEGLVLSHSRTGLELFIVHGHQADRKSDFMPRTSRAVVGYIWPRLQLLGIAGVPSPISHIRKFNIIERALKGWVSAQKQAVICGHTHRPMSAIRGEVPYFNTGSCVFPGNITGLEIANGEISLVSWFIRGVTRPGSAVRLERQLAAPPRKLRNLI